jgi:hypothetical protein
MIPPSLADEYIIRLTTGETLTIAELDTERSPALLIPQVAKACDGLLRHCTRVTREIMEEAKGGYDARFKPLLRASPQGCMAKADPHVCRLIRDCAMASGPICTLRNSNQRSRAPLPICWEFPAPVIPDLEVQNAIIELGSCIGHAWRRGLHVVIVDN